MHALEIVVPRTMPENVLGSATPKVFFVSGTISSQMQSSMVTGIGEKRVTGPIQLQECVWNQPIKLSPFSPLNVSYPGYLSQSRRVTVISRTGQKGREIYCFSIPDLFLSLSIPDVCIGNGKK